jgi:hypothetical protein
MDKTVPEWCKARHLSRSTYHKLKNLANAPIAKVEETVA